MGNPHHTIPKCYLFSGYQKLNDSGDLVVVPKSVEPVRNQPVFIREKDSDKDCIPYATNDKGVLLSLSKKFSQLSPLHSAKVNIDFTIPPPNSISYSWAAKGENWSATLKEFFKDNAVKGKGVELTPVKIKKDHLRVPVALSEEESEKSYSEWYSKVASGSVLNGYLISKCKGVLFIFSDPIFNECEVSVKNIENKIDFTPVKAVASDNGIFLAALIASPDELTTGLYQISVKVKNKNEILNKNISNEYTLVEKFRFNITTLAADLEIVIADPISLEEAMFAQFPVNYAYLIDAAKKTSRYPELSKSDAKVQGAKATPKLPTALKTWEKRYNWTHNKAKLVTDIINADSKLSLLKIFNSKIMPSDGPLVEEVNKSLNLVFAYLDYKDAWSNFVKAQKLTDFMSDLASTLDTKNPFAKIAQLNKWQSSLLRYEFTAGELMQLSKPAKMSANEWIYFKFIANGEKKSRLEQFFGKGGTVATKALFYADTAISLYQTTAAWMEASGARGQLTTNVADYNTLITEYVQLFTEGASREGIGNLERARALTVSSYLDLDKKTEEALKKSLDAALGVLVLIPATSVAASLVIAAKGLLEAGWDAASALSESADEYLFGNYFKALKEDRKLMADLQMSQIANMDLLGNYSLSDGGVKEPGVQYRLRAAALNGLFGLLTRASVSSESSARYLEKIRKYRVKEYIETFILKEDWELPVNPLVPLGMDAYWLYSRSPVGLMREYDVYASRMGFTKALSFTGPVKPFGMLFCVVTDKAFQGQAKAAFHKQFPIHGVDAGCTDQGIDDFCTAFKSSFSHVPADCVAYTRIYYRKSENGQWKPLEPNGKDEKIDELSPFDHIRVLIVLKNLKDGVYPVTLQLFRTDGLNIKGPIYKDIARKLDTDLLPDEQEFKGKPGCVIFPFYQLGYQTIPGIKPLAGSGVTMLGAGAYYSFGNLFDMTYAFKVKVGNAESEQWVKLGGTVAQRSELDDFPMSIRVSRNSDEKKLLVMDFLTDRTTEFKYPTLFQVGCGMGPYFLTIGSQPPVLVGHDEEKTISFFDWKSPVAITVLVWAEGFLATNDWKKMNLDWKHTPVQITLKNDIALAGDPEGPTYQGRLNYLGKLHENLNFTKDSDAIDENLSTVMKILTSNDSGMKQKIFDSIDPIGTLSLRSKQSQYHLFAAHISLYYTPPGGKRINSLRPFGKMMYAPDFYSDYFTLVTPTGLSGLECKARFKFAAPLDNQKVPWNPTTQQKWIEKQAKEIDANKHVIGD